MRCPSLDPAHSSGDAIASALRGPVAQLADGLLPERLALAFASDDLPMRVVAHGELGESVASCLAH
jgi:hypothetical protein